MTNRHAHRIQADVQRLLRSVPRTDLAGLDEIALVDKLPRKAGKVAGGLYWKRWDRAGWQQQPSRIDLAFDGIYFDMPNWLFYFPFVRRLLLASTLYHEIGHHVQHMQSHGIAKSVEENFADHYGRAQLKRAFPWWRLPVTIFMRLRDMQRCVRTRPEEGSS